MKVNIGGIEIDQDSFDQVTQKITDYVLSDSSPRYVVTPNAHHIVTLQKDAHFKQIYREAFLVVPDGVSLLRAAEFLQTPLNGRVNGTDLFERLCAIAATKGLNVFFLGGRPGAAENAAKILCERHSSLNIVGTYCPPLGFEQDEAELAKIQATIQAATPHLLFVGLGAPKQEYWMFKHCQSLNVPISVGIGVSFELVSGMVKRAPKLMQDLGLEWAFRLLQEPQRLWQRYVVCNTVFVWLVIRQRFGLLNY